MRPSPVAILTTSTSSSTKNGEATIEAQDYGVTLSSLTSLSLDPKPLLTFNVKVLTRTFSILRQSESPRILVHLLKSTSEGRALAEVFSRGYRSQPFRDQSLQISRWKKDWLPVVEWNSGIQSGSGENGVERVLVCRILPERLYVQDHVILVAEVLDILRRTQRRPSNILPGEIIESHPSEMERERLSKWTQVLRFTE